ncbi:MAG: hypothetical protein ACLP3Q_14200 [Streptosporangiaceae bacterium]
MWALNGKSQPPRARVQLSVMPADHLQVVDHQLDEGLLAHADLRAAPDTDEQGPLATWPVALDREVINRAVCALLESDARGRNVIAEADDRTLEQQFG